MDFGKVAGAFVLGGLSGGAEEYTRLQKEQSKFAQEQALKEAEELRQMRLKEYGVQLEMKNRVIGQKEDGSLVTQQMVSEGGVTPDQFATEREMKYEDSKSGQFLNGRELTNLEVSKLDPETQKQLKTEQQVKLEQHEALKQIDVKYREPRADALGNAKAMYEYKEQKEKAELDEALQQGIITEEELKEKKKADILGKGRYSKGSEDKVLPGVSKLREAVMKAGEDEEGDWDTTVAESKAFSRRYSSLSDKEKQQADQLYPGMAKQAELVSGVEKFARVAAEPGGERKFADNFMKSRGVANLPNNDPRKQAAIQELRAIGDLYSSNYTVEEVEPTGLLDKAMTKVGLKAKEKEVIRKE